MFPRNYLCSRQNKGHRYGDLGSRRTWTLAKVVQNHCCCRDWPYRSSTTDISHKLVADCGYRPVGWSTTKHNRICWEVISNFLHLLNISEERRYNVKSWIFLPNHVATLASNIPARRPFSIPLACIRSARSSYSTHDRYDVFSKLLISKVVVLSWQCFPLWGHLNLNKFVILLHF